MANETTSRSLIKALSYRILSSIVTGGIVFGATQQGSTAALVALFDSVIKILLYFFHERIWAAISFGQIQKSLEEIEIHRSLNESDGEALHLTVS